MTIFDQAQAIVQRWPDDKTAPAQLAALMERVPPEQAGEVSMFVEALYAAARDEGDLELVTFTWEDYDAPDE